MKKFLIRGANNHRLETFCNSSGWCDCCGETFVLSSQREISTLLFPSSRINLNSLKFYTILVLSCVC